MQIKQYLLIIFCLCFSITSFACMCLPYMKRLETDLRKETAYIASVKVRDLAPHPTGAIDKYIFTFELIEQLHGKAVDQLAVQSYHPDFQEGPTKTSSSCDFIVKQGVEYLIFARMYEGELITGFCNIIALKRNGVEHRGFDSAYALLEGVQEMFNITPMLPLENGKHKTYYLSGQLRSKAKYKNGRLHGKSFHYLQNGKKYIIKRYENGLFHGKQQRLRTNDNYMIIYQEGKRVGKAIYFGRTKKEKFKEEKYASNGNLISSLRFDEHGKVREEVIYDSDGNEVSRKYYKDGVLIEG